jgi:hypothetical protein
MKTIITLFAALIFSFYASAQQQLFYADAVSYNNEVLFKLNIATCDSIFIGYTDSIYLLDIAITSDHHLYGIDGTYLYEIDTATAHLTVISQLSSQLSGINALVADSAGNLLTVAFANVYQINRLTGVDSAIGYIGYGSGQGDLTFYNDTLYFAAGQNKLVKIILHPTVSAQLVGTMNVGISYIRGLNTICINNVETMIATGSDGFHSNLYMVNPANASLTLLCDTIVHQMIMGAASIYDFNGSGTDAGCTTITGLLNTPLGNDRVEVFPNPFNEQLTVVAKSNEPMEIVIYDIASQKIMQQQFTATLSLNTQRLAAGVYIYEVKNGNEVIDRGKLVKF